MIFRDQLEMLAGVVLGALTTEEQERVWARTLKARELRNGREPGGAHVAVAAYIASHVAAMQAQATREAMDGNN